MPYTVRTDLARRRASGELERGRCVRVAGIADAPLVARLLGESRGMEAASGGLEKSVRGAIAKGNRDFLIVFAGEGAPAGFAEVGYRSKTWPDAKYGQLEELFVSRHQRRRGLGRALVKAAMNRARARRCSQLEVDMHDAAAVGLFEGLGLPNSSEKGLQSIRRLELKLEADDLPVNRLGRLLALWHSATAS